MEVEGCSLGLMGRWRLRGCSLEVEVEGCSLRFKGRLECSLRLIGCRWRLRGCSLRLRGGGEGV